MSGVPGSVRGPSLTGRMAAAIALTAGFYLLALAMVAGLVALAVLPWLHGGGRPAGVDHLAGDRRRHRRRDRAAARPVRASGAAARARGRARPARHARR